MCPTHHLPQLTGEKIILADGKIILAGGIIILAGEKAAGDVSC